MLFLLFLIGFVFITFFSNVTVGWFASVILMLTVWSQTCNIGFLFYLITILFIALSLIFFFPPIRKKLLTPHIFNILKKMLPTIGETERIALEAGTVWWDREFFSGSPQWKKMFSFHERPLSHEEQAFLDGPVEELCNQVTDWEIGKKWDLPPATWDFIKQQKFFGMIIPKEYGGLGFGARAHSEVVAKIASRSTTAAVTVMVPNSLGPAELLLRYGTDEQKNYYLPRLATGEEIPCFGLTEPTAGSDAGSMKSTGVICKEVFDGQEIVGIRLNFEKRWITLAPISTVIGLAFVLKDPDRLLSDMEDIGITCALIPSDLSGVEVGRRHNPLHSSFHNGPIWGKDVFIPMDYIIGGEKMMGQGWRMLMECLAAGRSISLPALSCGNAKLALRTVYMYGHIREQFNLPIVKFEGVEEKLTEMAGFTYMMEAARTLTAGAVDDGEHPSVISAVMKAYTTEMGRKVINHAMDIRAGSEITLGPKNILSNVYISTPISITVEGANILTRTLIIFGQGAIRCHPHIQSEIKAIEDNNMDAFDSSFWKHIAFTTENKIRTVVSCLSNGLLSKGYGDHHTKPLVRQLSRLSASFAFVTDVCMGVLGGALKRKEKLSGRLADVLSWMYLTTASIKRYLDADCDPMQRPLMLWSSQYGLYQTQKALYELIQNLPFAILRGGLRALIFPWGRTIRYPSDALGHTAVSVLENLPTLNKITEGIFIPKQEEEGLAFLEKTYQKLVASQKSDHKIKLALKEKLISKSDNIIEEAFQKEIITAEEKMKLDEVQSMKLQAIQVDDFARDEFSRS